MCIHCIMFVDMYMQAVCGVKGYSVLHVLDYFDLIDGNPVDYMHCVLLGVIKRLLKLWLDSTNHRCEWLVLAICLCSPRFCTCSQYASLPLSKCLRVL